MKKKGAKVVFRAKRKMADDTVRHSEIRPSEGDPAVETGAAEVGTSPALEGEGDRLFRGREAQKRSRGTSRRGKLEEEH